jgi:hypothetical protein
VHVARRAGGIRRVEAIGEVADTGGDPVRPLFAWHGGALHAVGAARRAPRRPDVAPADPGWFAC